MPADLETLVAARDHQGLVTRLRGLDERATVEASRWYRASGRRQAKAAAEGRDRDAATVVVLLAVALGGARDAARACDFPRLTRIGRLGGSRLLLVLEIAAARGATWCRDFVEEVAERPVLAAWASPDEVVALCLPLVAHHGLDVPGGPAYAHGWTALAVESQRSHDPDDQVNHLARLDPEGRASYLPGLVASAGLAALLAATPRLPQTLERVLETPRALSMLTHLDQPGWLLGPAVTDLVASGSVERGPLVEAALRALTAGFRPSEQRVAAAVLEAAGFGRVDVTDRVPYLLSVLSTAHGSVTAVLLPVVLAAPLEPDDLRELGSVVLLRREKAQKVLLLDRLAEVPPDDPRGQAVVEVLRQAAGLDDCALADRAASRLRARAPGSTSDAPGVPEASDEQVRGGDGWPDVGWDAAPEPPATSPFRRAPATPAGLARLRAEQRPDLLVEARWLDLVVRRAAADPGALRAEVAAWPSQTWVDTSVEASLVGWATGRAPAEPSTWLPARGHRRLTAALAAETAKRLGSTTELLSTPSLEDGSLALVDLVERIGRLGTTPYGPADLLQALLRLGPVRPDEVALLDGVAPPPARPRTGLRRWWPGRDTGPQAAAGVVRTWVEAGGLPPRRATLVTGYASLATVSLPVVPSSAELTSVVADLADGLWVSATQPPPHPLHQRLESGRYLAVVPWWAEALAADAEAGRLEHRGPETSSLAAMVAGPGSLGPAVHLHLARLLAGWDPAGRSRAAELALTAHGGRRLDVRLLAEQTVVLLEQGVLSLARAADGWEQVVLGGGLALVWPSVRAVLARATTASPLPTGLAELLRMVRPYVATVAANVPGDVLPPGVAALAGSRSATKARAEARALLDAVAAAAAAEAA